MWVRTSRRTPASRATRAASAAVECPVSWARASSSLPKVASCTRRSAPRAASVSERQGRVSPEYTTVRPARGGPPGPPEPRCARRPARPSRPCAAGPTSGPPDAELASPLGVKPAQARVLHERVAHRVGAVLGLEHDDVVLVPDQPLAWLQLHDLHRELVPLDAEGDGGSEHPLRSPRSVEDTPAVRSCSPMVRSRPVTPRMWSA